MFLHCISLHTNGGYCLDCMQLTIYVVSKLCGTYYHGVSRDFTGIPGKIGVN